jgi:hypothetical protein
MWCSIDCWAGGVFSALRSRFLNGGSYDDIPLEQCAFELEQRAFDKEESSFSVEAEVREWVQRRLF